MGGRWPTPAGRPPRLGLQPALPRSGGRRSGSARVRRTQPSCSDTAARSGSSGPSPATSSVEPPPMSSDQERPVRRGRGRPPRRPVTAAPRRCRSGAQGPSPVASPAAARNSSPLAASRAADVATSRPRPTSEPVHDLAVLGQYGHASVDRLRGQAPRGVHPLTQAGDPHQPLERVARRRRPPGGGSSWCRSRWRRRPNR